MPIPQPHAGEDEQAFVSRCMGNDAMQEYEQKQRSAICYRTFGDQKKSASGAGAMRLYGAIEKVEPQDDGTVKVHGIASTEDVDDQGEIVQAAAMRAAIPEYMRFPALREMHQLSAAGTTLEVDCGDDGITRMVAHVVDPVAVSKVKTGTYRGFSIGGRVTEREAGNHKTITGLTLSEISLVDRPANPGAVFDMWKATGETPMPDGLGTLGDVFAEAIAKQAPPQIWFCGHSEHRHVKKDEAQKCMAHAASPEGQDAARKTYENEQAERLAQITIAELNKADEAPQPEPVPPEPVKRPLSKALWDVGQVASIILELDGLKERLEAEGAIEGDASAQPERLFAVIEELCGFLNALVAEETAEVLDGGEIDEDDMAMMMASRPSPQVDALRKALFDGTALLWFGSEHFHKLRDVFAKAGAAHSASDRMLMNAAHDNIMQVTDGMSCGDTGKAGARHSAETMGHLNDAHGSMVKAGAVCKAAETEEEHQGTKFSASTTEGSAMGAEVMNKASPNAQVSGAESDTNKATETAMDRVLPNTHVNAPMPPVQPPKLAANAGGVEALLKILTDNDEHQATIAKTLGGINENLTKLSERVERIEKQPMPALAASGVALPAGVIDVSKADDGRSVDHMAAAKSSLSQQEIAEIWKSMSSDERAMFGIRATLRNPYTQRGP